MYSSAKLSSFMYEFRRGHFNVWPLLCFEMHCCWNAEETHLREIQKRRLHNKVFDKGTLLNFLPKLLLTKTRPQ